MCLGCGGVNVRWRLPPVFPAEGAAQKQSIHRFCWWQKNVGVTARRADDLGLSLLSDPMPNTPS